MNSTQGGFLPGIGSVAGAFGSLQSPRWQRVRRGEPDHIGWGAHFGFSNSEIIFFSERSWGSDFCSKNGQKYWYLQCFVTKVGLKPCRPLFFGGAQRCSFCFARTIHFFWYFLGVPSTRSHTFQVHFLWGLHPTGSAALFRADLVVLIVLGMLRWTSNV